MARWWWSRGADEPAPAPEPAAPPAASATPRVTRARIAAWFESQGYVYFTDGQGELGGLWRSNVFSFMLGGADEHILQVRCQWHRLVTMDRIEEILEICNAWNTERLWPKCYVKVRDDGQISVVAEVSTEVEHGADDAQLGTALLCGLSAASLFFSSLDERYPDPASLPPTVAG